MNVYQYTDHRKLLRDYYEIHKRKPERRFSFRAFAKRAGLSSSNFLLLVMKGQRNISTRTTLRLARAMKLNKRESLFFESLVHFNQAKSAEEKAQALQKMLAFREYRGARKLAVEHYEYFSNWYYPAIRELVNLPDFHEDAGWIAGRLVPPITKENAAEALKVLERMGLLKRDRHGRLCQCDQNLTTDEEVVSLAVRKFHREMILNGLESLKRPSSIREISSVTMSLTHGQFTELKKRIHEFEKDIQKFLDEDAEARADSVYQLNLQLFPLFDSIKENIHAAL